MTKYQTFQSFGIHYIMSLSTYEPVKCIDNTCTFCQWLIFRIEILYKLYTMLCPLDFNLWQYKTFQTF